MGTEDYKKEASDILSSLGSDVGHGLSQGEAQNRAKKNGKNILVAEKSVTAWKILREQMQDSTVFILVLAATISILIGKHVEYLVIMSIVAFIILLSFFEEFKASREMEALKKLAPRKTRVIRDGAQWDILAEDVVPGDILVLRKGDVVCADARLITVNDLAIDESTLTGESVAVAKNIKLITETVGISQRFNMVLSSTKVTRGEGLAVVVGTGMDTEIGQISSLVKNVKEERTPLQARLDRLSIEVSGVTILISFLMIIVGVIRGDSFGDMALLAIAVAVAGIPESLPTVVGVCLALGMKRMAKAGAIVKRLSAVETLGTCTVICTDKTGTLTQNIMTVEEIILPTDVIRVVTEIQEDGRIFVKNDVAIDHAQDADLQKVLQISLFCNNAQMVANEVDGEPTEIALLELGKKAGMEKHDLHELNPRLAENPFDHDRKIMSVVHTYNKQRFVFMKGAPEIVIKKCTHFAARGKVRKMTPAALQSIHAQYEHAAEQGMRVLGLAYKAHTHKLYHRDQIESGLIYAGLVAMRDPPHPQVFNAVKQCQDAGIKVVMITGDNPITARAIAQELGIYQEGQVLLTGADIDKMTDDQLMQRVETASVFSRTTPKHKLRIVTALQQRGHIVAMTGDGVNDSPALKKANVGVAMGKSGTEVAKEAAEMVIIDDNFATIVGAIREGRSIYANIRKFIYYLISTTLAQVVLVFLAVLMGVPTPLTALMILFINLLTSDLPAIGLALEPAASNIMKQKPRDPKEGILNDYMWLKIAHVIPIFVLGIILFFMWNLNEAMKPLAEAQTIAFVAMTLFCLFHALNSKSFEDSLFTKSFWNNSSLLWGLLSSFGASLIVIYWPPAQSVFGTVPLSGADWLPITITTISIIFWVELQKAIVKSELSEIEQERLFRENLAKKMPTQ